MNETWPFRRAQLEYLARAGKFAVDESDVQRNIDPVAAIASDVLAYVEHLHTVMRTAAMNLCRQCGMGAPDSRDGKYCHIIRPTDRHRHPTQCDAAFIWDAFDKIPATATQTESKRPEEQTSSCLSKQGRKEHAEGLVCAALKRTEQAQKTETLLDTVHTLAAKQYRTHHLLQEAIGRECASCRLGIALVRDSAGWLHRRYPPNRNDSIATSALSQYYPCQASDLHDIAKENENE